VSDFFSEWSTYELADLLLFSPRTYYRLFESTNTSIWPAQFLALGLGAALAVLAWRRGDGARPRVGSLLALAWLWVALAFHLARYAPIHWAARWFAAAFALEALLLLLLSTLGTARKPFEQEAPARAGAARLTGLAITLFGLALQPLAGPLLGRSFRQIELFGLAPDPTAVVTLGLVLLVEKRRSRQVLLLAIPLLWCVVTGLTLRAMAAPDFWLTPAAGVVAVAAILRSDRQSAALQKNTP
jgi:hypothetical protein